MGLMQWEDDNRESQERHAKRLEAEEAERLRLKAERRRAGPADPGADTGGVFAGSGLAPEVIEKIVAAGFDTVERLAAAKHGDLAKIVGPTISGRARAWATAEAGK